ncbi:MAG: cyclic nucleotide-binding domain-containing protein [Alloprevotella sp.]|nr:cyclic nucleotide-binding domain-containing protein [Alloprevotella sp.]
MDSIFETLISLPLLKGISPDRLHHIVSATPLHFLKYLDREPIIQPDDPISHLTFLINGAVRVSTANHTGRFAVSHTLKAPDVIIPDFLFGRSTVSPSMVSALGSAGVVKIAKADYLNMLRSDEILLLNYLNLLSAAAQTRIDGVLSLTDGRLEERIAFWIVALTQRSSVDITLSCRQRDLYKFFGVQRSSFVATLESMAEKGILGFTDTEIFPLSREILVSLLVNSRQDPDDV